MKPLRLLTSAKLWRAVGYLAGYIPVGTVLFVVVVAAVTVSQALTVIWLGLPLLAASAVLIRGCAEVERRRAAMVTGRIPPEYQEVTGSGILAQLSTRWRDLATRRNLTYVVLMFPVLLIADAGVLILWLTCLAGMSLPVWYDAVPVTLADGTVGRGTWVGSPEFGVLITNLPSALLAAVVFFGLLLCVNRLVVATADWHARVARTLLGPYVDPLAEAKRILAAPGPLSTIG